MSTHIQLTITGGTELQRALAKDAICYFESQYLKRYRTLSIEVKIFKFTGDEKDFLGLCDCIDNYNKPRDFLLEFNSASCNTDFIKTIFHEMVHLKQYASGQLKDCVIDGSRTLWKNADFTETDYENAPWEVEAYELQEKIYEKYMSQEREPSI